MIKTIEEKDKIDTYRNAVVSLEEMIRELPGAMINDCFPLTHKFVNGKYIRTIIMPKDFIIVSKIHKHEHPYFVIKGEVSVITEDGVKTIKAPYQGITPAGTKRMLRIHKECTWITVHDNPDNITDLEMLEDMIIAKSFDDVLPDYAKMFIEQEVNPCHS